MQPGLGARLSPAADALGLGGLLRQQVDDETDEERKKREQRQREMAAMGPAATALGLMGGGGINGY